MVVFSLTVWWLVYGLAVAWDFMFVREVLVCGVVLGLWGVVLPCRKCGHCLQFLVYDLHLRVLVWCFELVFCGCCYCLLLSWVCFVG